MATSPLSRRKRSPSERQFKTILRANQANRPAYNAQLVTAVVAQEDLVLTFDRPVLLRGTLTGITTDVAEDEVSSARTGTNEITVTFAGSVGAATVVNFPPYTGNIRTRDGGFAVSPQFPVGA